MTFSEQWLIFQEAFWNSLAAIEPAYILIPRIDADTVFRERLFCYELYHQLRCNLGDIRPFLLHGEIDKRGQGFIRDAFGYDPNPDLIVHEPGTMNNLVVIEVKTSNVQYTDAAADIEKLTTFINKIDYKHGIFLVFGERTNETRLREIPIANGKITFIWLHSAGIRPDIVKCEDGAFNLVDTTTNRDTRRVGPALP